MANRTTTPHRNTPVEPVTAPKWLPWWWIPDVAFAALRVAAAALFTLHAVQELWGLFLMPGEVWLGQPTPFSDRWLAAVVELAGGALLTVGLFTRPAALALAVISALSYFAPARARGHWTLENIELIVFSCCVLLAFAAIGPGLFSADALFFNRKRGRTRSGMEVSMSPWIKRQYRRRELTR